MLVLLYKNVDVTCEYPFSHLLRGYISATELPDCVQGSCLSLVALDSCQRKNRKAWVGMMVPA